MDIRNESDHSPRRGAVVATAKMVPRLAVGAPCPTVDRRLLVMPTIQRSATMSSDVVTSPLVVHGSSPGQLTWAPSDAPWRVSDTSTASTSTTATWTPTSTAPRCTRLAQPSAREASRPARWSEAAKPPARCPAASLNSAASGPPATIGPMPGNTTATAAIRYALNSPTLAAARESSSSTPGEAPDRSANAPSSA